MNNYELAKIDYSNGLSTKEIADKYSVTVATVRKWKSRYNWNSVTKKRDKSVTTKKAKEVAKTLVEEGYTLKEASEKTGLSESTLQNYSAKEKWMEKQENFLKKVYGKLQDKLTEKHIQEKEEAIKALEYLKKRTMGDILKDNFKNLTGYNLAVKIIGESTNLQSKFLGLPDMKMYIKQDNEESASEKIKDRTINIKVVK